MMRTMRHLIWGMTLLICREEEFIFGLNIVCSHILFEKLITMYPLDCCASPLIYCNLYEFVYYSVGVAFFLQLFW